MFSFFSFFYFKAIYIFFQEDECDNGLIKKKNHRQFSPDVNNCRERDCWLRLWKDDGFGGGGILYNILLSVFILQSQWEACGHSLYV